MKRQDVSPAIVYVIRKKNAELLKIILENMKTGKDRCEVDLGTQLIKPNLPISI